VRDQISRLLKYFDTLPEGGKFRSCFVKDFLKRADLTIDQVKKDNCQDLQMYKLKDLRKVSKLPNVLDPNNLLFLSREIFSLQKFLVGSQKAEMAKVVFDLHLGFALIFKSPDDIVISQELVKGCSWALDLLLKDLDAFLVNPISVNNLLTSPIIIDLFTFMEKSTENSSKKRLLTEIIIKINQIFLANHKKNPDNSPLKAPFDRTEGVINMISAYQNLEHGRKFTNMMARIKLLALLSDKHSMLFRNFGLSYQTNRQMYNTFFKKTFTSQSDILISVDVITSKKAFSIVKTADKKSIMIDGDTFRLGRSNTLRVAQGEEVVIQFPVAVNEVKMAGKLQIRNYTEDTITKADYEKIEGIEQISACKVVARHHHAMFVGNDDEIMGMGYRASGKDEGMHKLRMIEKPEDCKNYLKVETGKFFRLLLTKDHKLFFSGQNKKYMLGKDIEVNAYAHSFVEIKDFYPLAPNEKIVDVAGGKHFMVVVSD